MAELSVQQMNEIKDSFRLFDKNSDGVISSTELESAMRATGCSPTKEEVQTMIEAIDTNRNGVVDFPEFVVMVSCRMKTNTTQKETGK